jgi:hypothetical protein
VRRAARSSFALALAGACALALQACGDTLQDQPIPHNELESLVVNPFPVYWLGGTFHGLPITEASTDPSGAVSIQYGDCLEGGQGTCVAPLRVVTSADNSFLPGSGAPGNEQQVRGVTARVAQAGRTIIIPTAGVVVDIYAGRDPGLARAAARTAVPINSPGTPESQLPPPQPDTGYSTTPLPTQEPTPLRPVR